MSVIQSFRQTCKMRFCIFVILQLFFGQKLFNVCKGSAKLQITVNYVYVHFSQPLLANRSFFVYINMCCC